MNPASKNPPVKAQAPAKPAGKGIFGMPEMRPFVLFSGLSLLIIGPSFFFLDLPIALSNLVANILIAAVLYLTGFSLAKKNTEARIFSSRLEAIILTLPDGVIVYDNEFKIMIFNPAAERIFRVGRDEALGQKIGPERVSDPKLKLLTQVIFPSLAPLVVKRSEAGALNQVIDISFTAPIIELRVNTSQMFSGGVPAGFIKIVTDRTREVEVYRSKSEFITIAAHQLQTPLTAVYWALDLLRKDESLSEENKEIAREGFISSQNVSKIVNDLLNVAKIEGGKFGYVFQEIDIVSFMGEIMKNANIFAKNSGVNLYFDPGPLPNIALTVDPEKLAMAVSNLIDNSIKYNLKNGSVTVKIELLPDKPFVQISIKDTGIGISQADAAQLFKKFFRAESALKVQTEGTGLGLYISKNIIKRHGGTIHVESFPGRGTTFYLTLPTDPKLIPYKESPYEEE